MNGWRDVASVFRRHHATSSRALLLAAEARPLLDCLTPAFQPRRYSSSSSGCQPRTAGQKTSTKAKSSSITEAASGAPALSFKTLPTDLDLPYFSSNASTSKLQPCDQQGTVEEQSAAAESRKKNVGWQDLEATLDACETEDDLRDMAQKMMFGIHFSKERKRAFANKGACSLPLNEAFLSYLASRPILQRRTVALERGSQLSTHSSQQIRDQFLSKCVRRCVASVPVISFSHDFILNMCTLASRLEMSSTLDALFSLVQRQLEESSSVHVADPDADQHGRTHAPALVAGTDAIKGKEKAVDVQPPLSSNDAPFAVLYAKALYQLMKGFSRFGKFAKVDQCFQLLREHRLPRVIHHYQYQLISLFHRRAQQMADATKNGLRSPTSDHKEDQPLLRDVRQIRTWMEQDNIALDDTFLATLVFGLGAPLRNPLLEHSTPSRATDALRRVRMSFDQMKAELERKSTSNHSTTAPTPSVGDAATVGGNAGSATSTASVVDSKKEETVFHHLPRFLYSLIHVELDAINNLSAHRSNADTLSRIQKLIEQLTASVHGNAQDGSSEERRVPQSETELDTLCAQIRISAMRGDVVSTWPFLRRLLDMDAETYAGTSDHSANRKRDLILKQRGSIILLFSAAMQHRSQYLKHDPTTMVLDLALRHRNFERVWRDRHLPSNLSPLQDHRDFEPISTFVRLWKRWLRSWAVDVRNHNTRDTQVGRRDAPPTPYRTYAGRNPWKTLSAGLRTLSKLTSRLERMDMEGAKFRTPFASSSIVQLGTIFQDNMLVDTMIHSALKGGRYSSAETFDRRILRILMLFRVSEVPVRVWKIARKSLLKHSTNLLKPADNKFGMETVHEMVDLINLNIQRSMALRQAKLELQGNTTALKDLEAKANKVKQTQPVGFVIENGTIFTLRRILESKKGKDTQIAVQQTEHQQQQHEKDEEQQHSSHLPNLVFSSPHTVHRHN